MVLVDDWDDRKFSLMKSLVGTKFSEHDNLMAKLVATGKAQLIEGNTWGDKIWGVCDGEGENHLGRILMEIREGEW